MAEPDLEPRAFEEREAVLRRFREARAAGLTRVEARLFAESDVDIGLLRKCVAGGCSPLLMAKVLL